MRCSRACGGFFLNGASEESQMISGRWNRFVTKFSIRTAFLSLSKIWRLKRSINGGDSVAPQVAPLVPKQATIRDSQPRDFDESWKGSFCSRKLLRMLLLTLARMGGRGLARSELDAKSSCTICSWLRPLGRDMMCRGNMCMHVCGIKRFPFGRFN